MKLPTWDAMRIQWLRLLFAAFLIPLSVGSTPWEALAQRDGSRQEEARDYFAKWLLEDVVYIITAEERAVFESLSTSDERESFIEQFWRRRDPAPLTSQNEFKEEHYRRIAYANDHFTSGMDGWRTDRGKIYIIHGPPDELQSFTAGHSYNRPMGEGGGTTRTFPFEIWRYRSLPGLGSDVELEFVDKTYSGSFELVFSPFQKDMLLNVPGLGLTLAEEYGLAKRADHPSRALWREERDVYPMFTPRAKDDPFERYRLFNEAQRPPEVKYQDLKQLVEVNVAYDDLLFRLRDDYILLSPEQTLVPITLQWENRDLAFESGDDGVDRAKVALYGIVTNLARHVVAEFEDEVVSSYRRDQSFERQHGRSMYQKILTLPAGNRYRLDLVVRDLNSKKVGVLQKALIPPRPQEDQLYVSPFILSNFIRMLADVPDEQLMFVLGDVWLRPDLNNRFTVGEDLGGYLQVYNFGIDQATFEPSFQIRYSLLQGGEKVFETVDDRGDSIHYFSGSRAVLVKVLRLGGLDPGQYRFRVEIRDRIKDRSVVVEEEFELVSPSRGLAASN